MTARQPERAGEGSANRPIQVRPGSGPTALRIVLGNQLRRLRESKGITPQTAAAAIRASHAKMSRLELGRVGFKIRDVADLLTLYGVNDEQERSAILSLVQQANAPGWWHQYSDLLPNWFELYLGLEQASSVVRTYEPHLVPGLLQNEDSARAVIQIGIPESDPSEIERRIELRLRRQQMLTQPDAPSVWAVFDEAALWRLGGREMMRKQIEHLLNLAELPNVTIQIVPFPSIAHLAAGGPFSILRFADPDLPDVVYLEQLTSALYLDKPNEVGHYLLVMDQLCVQAKSPSDTLSLLHSISKQL